MKLQEQLNFQHTDNKFKTAWSVLKVGTCYQLTLLEKLSKNSHISTKQCLCCADILSLPDYGREKDPSITQLVCTYAGFHTTSKFIFAREKGEGTL